MSSNVVSSAWPILSVLQNKTYSANLTDQNLWKIVVAALVEIAYNYLYEDVGLNETENKEISKYRKFLECLAAKGGLKSKRTLIRK